MSQFLQQFNVSGIKVPESVAFSGKSASADCLPADCGNPDGANCGGGFGDCDCKSDCDCKTDCACKGD